MKTKQILSLAASCFSGFSDFSIVMVRIALLWGLYSISRIATIFREGPLGDFGNQRLTIEGGLCIVALALLSLKLRLAYTTKNA